MKDKGYFLKFIKQQSTFSIYIYTHTYIYIYPNSATGYSSNVCIRFFETCKPYTEGLQWWYVCLFMLLVFVLRLCLMIFNTTYIYSYLIIVYKFLGIHYSLKNMTFCVPSKQRIIYWRTLDVKEGGGSGFQILTSYWC